jgi:hypothetical protein
MGPCCKTFSSLGEKSGSGLMKFIIEDFLYKYFQMETNWTKNAKLDWPEFESGKSLIGKLKLHSKMLFNYKSYFLQKHHGQSLIHLSNVF